MIPLNNRHKGDAPSWFRRRVDWLKPYALLARWDKPIGIWLLLLPGWWALALSPDGPSCRLMALFAVGAVAMRGAGCTINDMLDRQLDAQVERTRNRPLACGRLSLRQAAVWLVIQLAVGAAVLIGLPLRAIMLGLIILVPIGIYPLLKRITWWPQLGLGLIFNWGVPLGAAASGGVSYADIALYGAAVLWTIIYDTIYAHQDLSDDTRVGIKSTARLFGDRSRFILFGLAIMMGAALTLTGELAGLSVAYYLILAAALFHLGISLCNWDPDDPADCLRHFRRSRDFGLIILAAILAGKI